MSLDSTHITNRLSIFILQDGFSFLITNQTSSPVFFENHKLSGSLSVEELLKLLKSKIHINFIEEYSIGELDVIYGNPQFSIVPQAYFEESHLPHYIKYSSKLIEGDDFSYDEVPSIQANTVYIPYININNYLFDIFGSFSFTHVFTGMIEKVFSKSSKAEDYVKVHVSHGLLYVVAFQNQKLVLTNAFNFDTAEDIAYYILFCIEELNMNREELQIDFTGDFWETKENLAFEILSNYIRHIAFSNEVISNDFQYSQGFHEHYNLL